MTALAALFLLALSVKQDGTPLRTGCEQDSEIAGTLPAGAAVTIRFELSGEAVPCYKVAVAMSGKTVEGYLPASAIDGLDEFDKETRDARWVEASQVMTKIPTVPAASQGVATNASHLIETGQPEEALDLLKPELSKRQDPSLLALAGVAAWRGDDARGALDYWRQSLDLRPNPDLEALYHRVERETKGDQSTERLAGMRVMLRYDSATVSVDAARQMLAVLDQAVIRISAELGCSTEDRIVAIVQSRDAYRKTIDAAEWTAGMYDGRIRVPVLEGEQVDAALRRVFAHETVHACLSTMGRWPAWFQEGLAQKLSGDTLNPSLDKALAGMKLPRLENLRQDWSHLDTAHATAAYALALKAVNLFYENYSQLGIRNLLRNPDRLPAITADLDKRLGL